MFPEMSQFPSPPRLLATGSVPFPLGLGAAAIVGYALLCPALYGLQRVARPALQHAVRRCAAAVSHVMQQWGPLSQT